jgi:hypothetical protein
MGNETEKNLQNPGHRQTDIETDNPADPSRRNPSQSGEDDPDPSRKNPGRDRSTGEGEESGDEQERRAS